MFSLRVLQERSMLEQELEHSILVGLEYTDAFYPALYSVSHRP